MISWDFTINKPVCFVLHGHSLKELDNRIEEFRHLDVVWMSLNWWNIAGDVLKKIDKDIEYLVHYRGANGTAHPTAHRFIESEARGNSLLEFIYQCCENGVLEVYLFGADGFTPKDKKIHYYGLKREDNIGWNRHGIDTAHFNQNYPEKLIAESGLKLYNTSSESLYRIPKMSIDECLKKLNQANTYS